MAIQTATTGNLESAQRVIIAESRLTQEHLTPCSNLISKFTLGKGAKQMTVPKVSAFDDAQDLIDGVDMVDSEDIGVTTTDLTTAEVGIRCILTDKLVSQANDDINRMVGRNMGNSCARKQEKDVIALFSALNGGTTLGADNKNLTLTNLAAIITRAQSGTEPWPEPIVIVHHSNALYDITKSLVITPSVTYPLPKSLDEGLLKQFYKINVNGVPVFYSNHIAKIGATDSGYGAIFSKDAMCIIASHDWRTERDRDISLRAWEIVTVKDYGVFELDDVYGAPLRYEMGNPATDN